MANTTTFEMKPVITFWLHNSKNGNQYLSGKDSEGKKVVGFINGKKKNPKEPDMRFYRTNEKDELEEYFSLWVNVSKNDKKYASGKIGDQRVVGFFVSKAKPDGKIPYLNLYESDSTPKPKEDGQQEQMAEATSDVPF